MSSSSLSSPEIGSNGGNGGGGGGGGGGGSGSGGQSPTYYGSSVHSSKNYDDFRVSGMKYFFLPFFFYSYKSIRE